MVPALSNFVSSLRDTFWAYTHTTTAGDMKVASEVLKTLNCSAADLKPFRMGFQLDGKSYIYKDGGQLAQHRAEFVGAMISADAGPGEADTALL